MKIFQLPVSIRADVLVSVGVFTCPFVSLELIIATCDQGDN